MLSGRSFTPARYETSNRTPKAGVSEIACHTKPYSQGQGIKKLTLDNCADSRLGHISDPNGRCDVSTEAAHAEFEVESGPEGPRKKKQDAAGRFKNAGHTQD